MGKLRKSVTEANRLTSKEKNNLIYYLIILSKKYSLFHLIYIFKYFEENYKLFFSPTAFCIFFLSKIIIDVRVTPVEIGKH